MLDTYRLVAFWLFNPLKPTTIWTNLHCVWSWRW